MTPSIEDRVVADFARRANAARQEISPVIREVIRRHGLENPNLGTGGPVPAVLAGLCVEIGRIIRDNMPDDMTEAELVQLVTLSVVRGLREPRPN